MTHSPPAKQVGLAAALGWRPRSSCRNCPLLLPLHPTEPTSPGECSPAHSPSLPDGVVNDDGIWVLQEPRQLHGDLREAHADTVKDLEEQSRAFAIHSRASFHPSQKGPGRRGGIAQPWFEHGRLTDASQSLGKGHKLSLGSLECLLRARKDASSGLTGGGKGALLPAKHAGAMG